MSDRTLPHDLDAEKSVLGAVLSNNQAFNQAAEVVDAADFYRDAHRRIFEKMVGLTDQGSPVDLLTLKDELARSGELDEVGRTRVHQRADRRRAPVVQRRALREDRQGEVRSAA